MGTIVSALSGDGSVACYAMDSTDIVAKAERIHKTSATVTAALGRLLTAASLMGCMCKGEEDSVTVRISGDGPTGNLIAVSDSGGNVRGCVDNPIVEIPLNRHGKLDVAGAVGRSGTLYVIRDMGLGEPYVGQTPIVSGEIAEDITHYYAVSEQIPTVCALGVLVMRDLSVMSAGGFLLQLLPGAAEGCIRRLEESVAQLPPVTELLSQGVAAEELALRVMEGLNPTILGGYPAEYRCNCSRKRVERALISVGREELEQMAREQPDTEVHCHFCGKDYHYSPEELYRLIESAIR